MTVRPAPAPLYEERNYGGLSSAGLDPLELARAFCASRVAPHSGQLLNELLLDVRPWRKLPPEEVAPMLDRSPLAACAALEVSLAAAYLEDHALSDSDFLLPFNRPEILMRTAMLCLADTPEELAQPARAWLLTAQGEYGLLLLLQYALRWAQRFAGWSGHDLRALMRLNLEHEFFAAVVDLHQDLPPATRILLDALGRIGVRIIKKPSAVAPHHLDAWLAEALGIPQHDGRSKQQRLEFKKAGGTENSLYVVRAEGGVDGVDVRGAVGPDLALIIDISDKDVNAAATAYLEDHIIRTVNQHTDLMMERSNGSVTLKWFDSRLEAAGIGQLIYDALKREFVLETISVNIIFDPLRIRSLRPGVLSYKEQRATLLRKRSEEASAMVLCTSCSSYAPTAFCLATPDRPPCCGRSYDELATLAQLTNSLEHTVVEKGSCQDRARGVYLGANKLARQITRGQIRRIELHSLLDDPHPTTAIPECIVYFNDELGLYNIVSRDYIGRTPDSKTYLSLLARVAGRQSPGFLGVSEEYIASPRFLSVEGGLARVGWMNSALKARLGVRSDQIATEEDCRNMAGLKEFLATWRR